MSAMLILRHPCGCHLPLRLSTGDIEAMGGLPLCGSKMLTNGCGRHSTPASTEEATVTQVTPELDGDRPGKQLIADTLATFTCDCGGTVTLAEEVGTREAVALHSLPECKWFIAADSKALVREWERKQRS